MNPLPLTQFVIIFDLDGTLVDSALDLAVSLNVVLKEEGLAPLPYEVLRKCVGYGAIAMMTQGFAAAGVRFPEGKQRAQLLKRFLDHYSAHIADRTVPFPGCLACLDALQLQGAKLAVCTNKLGALAVQLLEALSLSDYFAQILGRDALPEAKPSAYPLKEIIRRTDRPKAIMIGDTYTDRDAARNAGIPCILADFGYGTFDEALGKNEQIFSHFDALTDIISTLAVAK